jgi:glycosyltransferase involved in cell wall biosynthesis
MVCTIKGEEAAGGRGVFLLVVIPCLNEENTVGWVVSSVPRDIDGISKVEVLVFDDGSSDATAERAREAGAEVISHSSNQGLGATFRDAVGIAIAKRADIMVHIDGDGQFDPADIPLLVEPVVSHRADMVTASRFLKKDLIPEMPRVKLWGNRGVALIVRMLSGKRFRDVSCGFRVFSRETLLRMNLFGSFTYTQESFLDLIFKDMTILEVPVKVRGVREFGLSRVASSIPRYAFRSLKIMLRAFISYKPFRLFFTIALIHFLIAFGFLGFLGLHYLETGAFSPHIWAGFVGGSFAFLGFTTLITGLIGDMLVRIRMNQEAILYHLKRSGPEGGTDRDAAVPAGIAGQSNNTPT